jgi:hypothetical protein
LRLPALAVNGQKCDLVGAPLGEEFLRDSGAIHLREAGRCSSSAGYERAVLDRIRQIVKEHIRGAAPRVAFLVPSLLESVNFRIRKVADIDVSYRKRDRRLMRYRGLANIRDAGGELLEARIDFPVDAHAIAAVNLAALREIPLAPCK